MKDELKLSYWNFAMTTIIVCLIPIIFNQIIVFSMQSFTPEMYSSFKRSDNVITKHFIDYQFATYLAISLFSSLALGIFKHYTIPFCVSFFLIYPFLPYVEKLDIYSTLLNIFLIPFSITFACHYTVLRILFINFPKIKKIAYISMIILILFFLFIITIDNYRYSINKFGYQYNIDNLSFMIGIIPIFIFFIAFIVLFITFIVAYVYCWKNRFNILRTKGALEKGVWI